MKKLTTSLLLISSSFEQADIRYATRFTAPDPFFLLFMGKKKVLLVPSMEAARAARQCPEAEVLTPYDLPLSAEERRSRVQWLLGLLKLKGLRRCAISQWFPVGYVQFLAREGFHLEPGPVLPLPARACKNETELLFIMRAQRAAVAAMRQAVGMIREARVAARGLLVLNGRRLTSEWIKEQVEDVLAAHGCQSQETIAAVGRQAAQPHERGSGPLRTGEPVVLDIFPQHLDSGYWGDLTRTVVKGRAPERLRAMYGAVQAARRAAFDLLRPGVPVRRVHRAVQAALDQAGFQTRLGAQGLAEGFIHSTGHGLGLEVHEAPSLRDGPGVLRVGHVVTIEPGLYYPDIGGVRIEDTVVITDTGFRFLVPCPEKLELR